MKHARISLPAARLFMLDLMIHLKRLSTACNKVAQTICFDIKSNLQETQFIKNGIRDHFKFKPFYVKKDRHKNEAQPLFF